MATEVLEQEVELDFNATVALAEQKAINHLKAQNIKLSEEERTLLSLGCKTGVDAVFAAIKDAMNRKNN